MEDLIRKKIKEYGLQKKKLIIAVSGGVDSVVLLDLLSGNISEKRRLIVACVNHGIRKDSDEDELLVRRLAQEKGLPYYSTNLKMTSRDEATARDLRLSWLQGLAKELSVDYILMAHHLNDQIETVLLRLIRGVGPLGLVGMTEISGKILRPLLSVEKKEILAWAKKNKLTYREDSTNQDLGYARNRVRARVLPELLVINPALLDTFCRNRRNFEELTSYLKEQVKVQKSNIYKDGLLDLVPFLALSPFLGKLLIKDIIHEVSGSAGDIYQKNIEEIYEVLSTKGNKKTKVGDVFIKKEYGFASFSLREGGGKSVNPGRQKLTLSEKTVFGNFVIKASLGTSALSQENNILLPASFSDNLSVRTWLAGDKIKTVIGTKKIQDIFTDAKISPEKRKSWPLILHGDEIVWVPLLAASHYVKKEKNNLIIEVL